MVEAKDIHKSFDSLEVLKGVSLSISKGEVVAIVGASGAGKTTLLQILGTLDRANSGTVLINGEDVNQLSDDQLAEFRNKRIGFVFQFHQLLPEFTAIENVMIPAWISGTNRKQSERDALELLCFLGLENRKNHKPNQLSGGEKQRVAIARALINKPAVVFADEPSGNLDSHNAAELQRLFFDLRDRYQQTFVIVTHDMNLAQMCDRMIVMKDGRVEQQA